MINCADALCTTPDASQERAYLNFNHNIAKAAVLDEAGAMTMAEAFEVWRDSLEHLYPPRAVAAHLPLKVSALVAKGATHLPALGFGNMRKNQKAIF